MAITACQKGTCGGSTLLTQAQRSLLPVNAVSLPTEYTPRAVQIVTGSDTETTDFFAFDTSDHDKLRKDDTNAGVVEMNDASLGLALVSVTDAPPWVSVRNASEPGNLGGTLTTANKLAEASPSATATTRRSGRR
jgi:hypothetical protein